jgi:hypothetical protein
MSKAIKIKEANRKKHQTQPQSSEQLEEILPTDEAKTKKQQGKQNSKPLETNKTRNKKRKSHPLEAPKMQSKKHRKNPGRTKLMMLVSDDDDECTVLEVSTAGQEVIINAVDGTNLSGPNEASTANPDETPNLGPENLNEETTHVLEDLENQQVANPDEQAELNPSISGDQENQQVVNPDEQAELNPSLSADQGNQQVANPDEQGELNPSLSALHEVSQVSEAAATNVEDPADSAPNDSGMRNPEVSAVLDATPHVCDHTISAVDVTSIDVSSFYARAMVDQEALISISVAFEAAKEVFLSTPRAKDINHTLLLAFINKLVSLSKSKKAT